MSYNLHAFDPNNLRSQPELTHSQFWLGANFLEIFFLKSLKKVLHS